MGEMRRANRFVVGEGDGKRQLWRSNCRCEGTDIKDGGCEGVYWLNLIQNKGNLWAREVTVTSLLMP